MINPKLLPSDVHYSGLSTAEHKNEIVMSPDDNKPTLCNDAINNIVEHEHGAQGLRLPGGTRGLKGCEMERKQHKEIGYLMTPYRRQNPDYEELPVYSFSYIFFLRVICSLISVQNQGPILTWVYHDSGSLTTSSALICSR
jgi:hypothetical protein